MRAIESYDQATVDRLCQAVAWATANEETATRLAHMGVEESGLGDWLIELRRRNHFGAGRGAGTRLF